MSLYTVGRRNDEIALGTAGQAVSSNPVDLFFFNLKFLPMPLLELLNLVIPVGPTTVRERPEIHVKIDDIFVYL